MCTAAEEVEAWAATEIADLSLGGLAGGKTLQSCKCGDDDVVAEPSDSVVQAQ